MTIRSTRARPKGQGRGSRSRRKLTPRNAGAIKVQSPDWFIHHPWLKEAGVYVNRDTALQLSAVYGCCRLIVDSIAPAPINIYELEGKGARSLRHDDPVSFTLNHGADPSRAPDAPTAQAIEEAIFWSALIHGDGYAEIQYDLSDRFFALWPLEPERVSPKRDENGALYYEVRQPTGGVIAVPPYRMFHLRGPSLFGWVGDSIVYRAAKAIGLGLAAQVFSAAYFANGTVLSGYLKTAKTLTPDQAKRHGASWKQNYEGPEKAHGTPILHSGMEYAPLNHDAQKSQLVESRKFETSEVARYFGVPLTLLADNEAWTNLSELYQGFFRSALKPWASRFDQEASRKLVPWRQPWREIEHDLTALTLGSFKDQVSALVQATGNKPVWTVNEARAVLGKNSMPGQDTLEPLKAEPAVPAKPAEKPQPDEGDDEPMPMPRKGADIARVAVALDRFGRRVLARCGEGGSINVEERAKLLPGLIEECRKVLTDAADAETRIEKTADAVLAGEPAHLAAERLLT